MTEQEKPKTRWGCIITAIIVVLIIGGLGYLFYAFVYPVITQQGKTQNTYTLPQINKEGKDKVQNIQNFGNPIKDNEQTGRADPFAPID
jgi:predicted PurR-regulated permease PerM